jgi:hypothetical protein
MEPIIAHAGDFGPWEGRFSASGKRRPEVPSGKGVWLVAELQWGEMRQSAPKRDVMCEASYEIRSTLVNSGTVRFTICGTIVLRWKAIAASLKSLGGIG